MCDLPCQGGLSGLVEAIGQNLDNLGEFVVNLASPSSPYWQDIKGIGQPDQHIVILAGS